MPRCKAPDESPTEVYYCTSQGVAEGGNAADRCLSEAGNLWLASESS